MRLLFVNPNITEAITDMMAAEARRSVSPGTVVVPATGRFGTLFVENGVEAAIAGHAVVDAVAQHAVDCDAVVVSAFGDPGLRAAKELLDIPVIGVSEAALLTAYTLGRRYSIVCLTARHRTWYMECATDHGLHGRMASARALTVPVPDITKARDQFRDLILEQCLAAVDEDDAEVIILGGGPMAGLARELRDLVPVPILDPIGCGVRMAEMLVALNPRPPLRGSFARPPAKPAKGLSADLMRMLTGEPSRS